MAGFAADDDLEKLAMRESAITHFDPLAGVVAAAVVVLCRNLVHGMSWMDSVEAAQDDRRGENAMALDLDSTSELKNTGYAPDVLQVVIHFLNRYEDLTTALEESFEFAGVMNYCPVLVESISGARWGMSAALAEIAANGARSAELARTVKSLVESWPSASMRGPF